MSGELSQNIDKFERAFIMQRPISGNIVLIGFLCSGKSTTGKILSQKLSLTFCDIDHFLEQELGPIPAFIEQFGVAAFRDREHRLLIEKMPAQGAVIGTGAGTILPLRSRTLLAAFLPQVYFLDAPFQVLYDRMVDLPLHLCRRPDFLAAPTERSRLIMLDEYRRRRPLYQRLGITVDATCSPLDVAENIANLVCNHK